MRAMCLNRLGPLSSLSEPLRFEQLPLPEVAPNSVRIRVSVCGVCHTELDEIEGRTPPPSLPVIPGHQAIGRIESVGEAVGDAGIVGQRVGVAWIHGACGECVQCLAGFENLCPEFVATGRDVDGGYAEFMTAPAAFVVPIPDSLDDLHAAPLLCAGAIGYRSFRLTGVRDGGTLGMTGFGASAHLVIQLVRHLQPSTRVFVFARDVAERKFAEDLGAVWAGDTRQVAPEALDAIIDTTPAWTPVLFALRNLRAGGRLVVNAIRKEAGDQEAFLELDYGRDLWMEKEIKSVANVTRRDVVEMLDVAAQAQIVPEVVAVPLEDANQALFRIREGGARGAQVLRIGQ